MSSVDYSRVRAWRISDFTGLDKLNLQTCSISPPKRGQVAVRVHAVSLNFRDLIIATGKYPGYKETSGGGLIPCSDGAGVVVQVGEDVSEFKAGDRVITTFHTNWESGPVTQNTGNAALGGSVHGALTEIGVFEQNSLVHVPDSLSFEEASTLPCAPLTAWTALRDTPQTVGPQSVVLVQGTGGVSIFAAQLALVAGARVIATSSSDDKLQAYKTMGVKESDLINYTTHPDWAKEVRKRVPLGVDHVIEVSGQLKSSAHATKKGGIIHAIGGVGGALESVNVWDLVFANVMVSGILVGSRTSLQDLLLAIQQNGIKPIIDKVFNFDKATEAFSYLQSQKHIGKVVIKIH